MLHRAWLHMTGHLRRSPRNLKPQRPGFDRGCATSPGRFSFDSPSRGSLGFACSFKMAVSRVLVGSVGVAMLLVGLVAYMGSSPSTTVTHEEMLESPLFYHGSNGNGVCLRSAPRRFVVRHS